MSMNKPFSWIVRFTVSPEWVADGFSISDDRALSMLSSDLSYANSEELSATVLEAPSAIHIANVQGYTKDNGGSVVRELIKSTPEAGKSIRSAIIAARDLLDSVAFVSEEGDTALVLEKLNAALEEINPRQGEPVEIEM